ncbi:hypothetical protein P7K49_026079 [Saguinus oedipus]|uniref:Uncharacterized protein n=1 Tax=Saguinus oedipus TaxID=9490 RepID=A0ABQ9UJU7_SAGOE|nr:hypothetical protein P7K49_026079 [Saguinus oedipus]
MAWPGETPTGTRTPPATPGHPRRLPESPARRRFPRLGARKAAGKVARGRSGLGGCAGAPLASARSRPGGDARVLRGSPAQTSGAPGAPTPSLPRSLRGAARSQGARGTSEAGPPVREGTPLPQPQGSTIPPSSRGESQKHPPPQAHRHQTRAHTRARAGRCYGEAGPGRRSPWSLAGTPRHPRRMAGRGRNRCHSTLPEKVPARAAWGRARGVSPGRTGVQLLSDLPAALGTSSPPAHKRAAVPPPSQCTGVSSGLALSMGTREGHGDLPPLHLLEDDTNGRGPQCPQMGNRSFSPLAPAPSHTGPPATGSGPREREATSLPWGFMKRSFLAL